jgi:protein TonB
MAERHFWQGWPMALRWAVGLSLAIHLLVILPLTLMLETPIAMPQAPLSAVLKGPGAQVVDARKTAPRPAPVSAGDTARSSRQPAKPPPQKPDQDRSAPAPKSGQSAVGVPQGDTTAPANAASRAENVGGAPDRAREGLEADALNRYRLALGAEARKARRYPEVSRTRGQEGTTEVYVVLSRFGGGPLVVAGKSSGSPTLDEGALVMVRVAAERTPVPPELQGRNLKIPLRIRFTLDDF